MWESSASPWTPSTISSGSTTASPWTGSPPPSRSTRRRRSSWRCMSWWPRSRVSRPRSSAGRSRTTSSRSTSPAGPGSSRPSPRSSWWAIWSSTATRRCPRFNAISVSGTHILEYGANTIQAVSLAIAIAEVYIREVLKRGSNIDQIAPALLVPSADRRAGFQLLRGHRPAPRGPPVLGPAS